MSITEFVIISHVWKILVIGPNMFPLAIAYNES